MKQQISPIREVAKRVRKRREDLGMSQADLATAADLDHQYLSRFERGLQNCTLLVLFRLALELGVELAVLIEGVEVDPEELRAIERLSRGPRGPLTGDPADSAAKP